MPDLKSLVANGSTNAICAEAVIRAINDHASEVDDMRTHLCCYIEKLAGQVEVLADRVTELNQIVRAR